MSTNTQHTHSVHQDWMGKAWDIGTFPFLGGIPVSVHYAWPLFAGVFLISGTVSYWKILKGTAIRECNDSLPLKHPANRLAAIE